MLIDALVSIPAKSNVIPNARTMGHAVRAGNLTVSRAPGVPVAEAVGTT